MKTADLWLIVNALRCYAAQSEADAAAMEPDRLRAAFHDQAMRARHLADTIEQAEAVELASERAAVRRGVR